MISEKQFAESFAGFWNQCLPFLTPQSMAELNAKAVQMVDSEGRDVLPLDATEPTDLNDLVAETAFGMFAAAHRKGESVRSISQISELCANVAEEAFERIRVLRIYAGKEVPDELQTFTDAVELAIRLESFFERENIDSIVIQPKFPGCGILNTCFGDVHGSDCLYEIKTVERNIRSSDIRQVLGYCALNSKSHNYSIKSVCLLNPRRGQFLRIGLEMLAQHTARKHAADLMHEIGEFLINFETILHSP